ncbi:type 4a pilus biogenesis protein PilO [Candidatus Falkowbacteria bacterium]|nr:type 4a pilus biogenesis protein PilO [Candidatus Falkowbacteria bacterium]
MNLSSVKKLGLKEKILLINLVLIGISGSLIYFLILPNIDDINRIKKEIDTQLIDLEVKYQRGQSIKKLNANLKKIEPDIATLDQVFIKETEQVNFITSLEELATKHNLKQKLALGKAQKSKSSFKKIPLQISLEGSYRTLLAYLHDLETLGSYVNVKSIDIISTSATNVDENGMTRNNISANLSVETYWQ